MANGPTRASIHVRVRRVFLEELPQAPTGFIDTSEVPDELDQGYDEGCNRQFLVVFQNAERTGRLEEHQNPYLKWYLQQLTLTYDPITNETVLPDNLFRIVRVSIDGRRASYRPETEFRLAETFPSRYAATKLQPYYRVQAHAHPNTLTPPRSYSGLRSIKIEVYGGIWSSGSCIYYRTIDPIAFQSPPATYTDCPDPFNDGPVAWAAARLCEKAQQTEAADRLYARATEFFNRIIPPPMQGPQ